MDLSHLQNKKIYLAPHNDLTMNFSEFLEETLNTRILNFLDKKQKNNHTLTYGSGIIDSEADFFIVMSPNYFNSISDELIKQYVPQDKILYIDYSIFNHSYHISRNKLVYLFRIRAKTLYEKFRKYTNISYFQILLLKNKHKHQRAFIIGNGPSLKTEDLALLQDEITFAANKIYLAFEMIKWRPTYYFVVDKLVFSQNYDKINSLNLKKFFSIDMIRVAPKMNNALYFNNIEKRHGSSPLPTFYANPFQGINKGNTVVYAMTEFAVYMGIKELYFIGMDFNFIVNEDSDKLNDSQTICSGEVNHFHKEYRKEGEKWNKPNMQGLQNSFLKIREYCEEHDIKVFNATRGGKLEILERVDFDSLFQK